MAISRQDQREQGRSQAVLRVLRDEGRSLTIAEVAERLDIHANTARFHLATLASRGQIERAAGEKCAIGRPALRYQSIAGMDPMGQRHFKLLAEVLVASVAAGPAPELRAQEAGHEWGQRAAAASRANPASAMSSIGQLVGLLDEFGFDPVQISVSGASGASSTSDRANLPLIGLRNCPFLELAVDHADVVCPIHLGLMQGAVEAWDASLAVNELKPFVEPGLCVARVESITR